MTNTRKLNRRDLTNSILEDLHEFRSGCSHDLKYPIDENINFFQSAKSLPKYIWWLIRAYPNIDKKRIKELADFHLHDGLWEEYLLKGLIKLEKSKKIDLIGPLREELFKQLQEMAANSTHPLVVINVGCGAMEIERQIIDRLIKSPLPVPIVFIGIDDSKAALSMARENLLAHKDFFNVSQELSSELINKLKTSGRPYEVQFVLSDAISSLSDVPPKTLDIAYYSKFLHHLSDINKEEFKKLLIRSAKRVIEFDDYRGFYLPILSLLTNWRNPILLNGAVFSSLRVPSRLELRQEQHSKHWTTKTYTTKGYVKSLLSGK